MHSSPSMFAGLCLAFLGLSNALAIRTTDCNAAITLPVNGGGSELPASNRSLVYVAIGRGTQNYTCTGAGATPVANGAVATLFDATPLAYREEWALGYLPPAIVYQPVPAGNLVIYGSTFKVLGKHYFDTNLAGIFNLYTVGKIFYGAKTVNYPAPASANAGPAGTGAVDWRQLTTKAGYTSIGIQEVYRVVTAGGNPSTCTSSNPITVPYAAEYWMYN